jgi:phosphoglycerate dehydrogenase-like enzyme
MVRVAVLDDYQKVAAGLADWASLGVQVDFFDDHVADADLLVERLAPYEVVVAMRERTPFRADLIERLPSLRLLVTTGMKNAAIDIGASNAAGVTVCGTGSPVHATAELAFGLVLVMARGLVTETGSVVSGGWQIGLGRDVRGATLGLIGLGRLGAQMAGFAKAFGMDVVAWSENLTPERAEAVGARAVSKNQLLAEADFVSIHLRLSDRTVGLIGQDELAIMRPHSYLVNTSRGPIVDESALLKALREGGIAGAAIDVFEIEPLPVDHPFRSEPRLVLTPHIGYVTRETYEVFFTEAVEDIAAWIAGSPVRVLAP